MIGQDEGIPDITNPPANATEEQKIAAATAVQRQTNVALLSGPNGIKAITSASTSTYPAVAADCSDPSGIPPPQCTDEVSNQRRLAACQAAWAKDANYYEGTDRVLTSPLNVLRASLHPDGMARHIVNLGEWRAHLLGRLRRQIALTADSAMQHLYDELRAYPCERPEPEVTLPGGAGDVVVPLRIRHGGGEPEHA